MNETRLIPIGLIVEPPEPMRLGFDEAELDALAQDIRTRGLLSPLIVYPAAPNDGTPLDSRALGDNELIRLHGMYKIAAGHRRFLACRMIGLREVLCMVREGTADDYEGDMIAENMFRQDLTPFEEGNRFQEIAAREGMTEERLRRLCGNRPLSYIYSRMKLMEGDEEVALAVHHKKINLAVASELNKVSVEFYRQKLGELTPEQDAALDVKARQHRRYLLALACDTGTTKNQAHSWVVQWEIQEGLCPPPDPVPMQPAPQSLAPGFVPVCFFCGQSERPYDLENVYICRNELRAIKVAYERTPESQ